jgi:2-C-methyl-D-erythritol 4-phosphate cytidylyltransferase / 2-C-methyl-D-erythritol 2,4-cyclodiphosphate synthase
VAGTGEIAMVVVAAGRGERAGQEGGPKQYRLIGGKPVIRHTLEALYRYNPEGRIILVIHPDDVDLASDALAGFSARVEVVNGSSTRQASTLKGLDALTSFEPEFVLIHDGVRPFLNAAMLQRLTDSLQSNPAVIPAIPVSETLKRASNGLIDGTTDRAGLYAAQTPQAFRFKEIYLAHKNAAREGIAHLTDDASIAEWAGIPVRIVEGSPDNIKLTWKKDIELADKQLQQGAWYPDVRTGNGYDVHSFEPGDHVTLCGVRIPHEAKLNGHSDSDVALHALTDALLATCSAGDIGTHFPPSDPQWKGAASALFVRHAAKLVRENNGRIANADITLICEAPKIGPHRDAMVGAISEMLEIAAGRISVKATTNEKLGFIGRREGIAAIATATVVYPGSLE